MRSATLIIIVSLPTVFILSACGPSQAELGGMATQMAANIFATQTAQAPTSAPTFTPSPTPTAKPTLTLIPTNTPTITPTPTPPLMAVALTQDELPAGFQAMSAEELSDLQERMPTGAIAFGFGEESSSQLIRGYLVPYTTRAEQLAFDKMSPDLVDSLAAALGADTNPKNLSGLDDVGETRAGCSFVTEMTVLSLRWDIIIFRRGEIGVYLFIAYPDGDEPAVPVGDLARLLDGRLGKLLGVTL